MMAQLPPASTSSTTSSNPFLNMPTTPSSLLDLLISLHLSLWPALSLAVSLYTPPAPSPSNPNPPSSGSEVRDWLSGAVSSMIENGDIRDRDDLEEVLLQVIADEFEVFIEDGSETVMAGRIWRGTERVRSGDEAEKKLVEEEIKRLWGTWMERGGNKAVVDAAKFGKKVEVADDAQDTDDEEDEDEDEEMEDAPALVDRNTERPPPRRVRVESEIDEEGFTKVVKGKKR